MKLKRVFQLVEELASRGFDSSCDDMSDEEDAEYRVAMDKLWREIEVWLCIPPFTIDTPEKSIEWQEALNWLRSKDKWQ
jgi:hypothetical protein